MHEHGTFERYVVAWHHRVDTTEGASAQCLTWIFKFWAIWAAQGSKEKNYELLPTFGGDFLCFHGPKIQLKSWIIQK